MAKRALCVGINDYPYEDSDLNGCVNDAQAWAEMLTQHFDFPVDDVRIITDTQATKQAILAGLKDLLKGAKKGDILVFTNSSHGSYLLDRSGDEEKYDQVLCPHDIADNVVLDDELRELFAATPNGVQLVALLDNCHSGGGTRLPTKTRRRRFLEPEKRGDPTLPDGSVGAPSTGAENYPESGMRELLLSGCMAHESSYDDLIGGRYHGAMTYYALETIRNADYRLTYTQLHNRLGRVLTDERYDQHPQLEGTDENKARQVFA